MFYTALLKLHILLIAVPSFYGVVGGDVLHHPLIVHVAQLSRHSRAGIVGVRPGSVDRQSYSAYECAESSNGLDAADILIGILPSPPCAIAIAFTDAIGNGLSPRAP